MQIEIKMNGEMHEMRSILKAIALSQMVDRTESFDLKAVENAPVAVNETVENVTETDENVTGTTNTETFNEVVVDTKNNTRSEAAKKAAATRKANLEAAEKAAEIAAKAEAADEGILYDSVDDSDVTLADIKTFAMDLVQRNRKSLEVNGVIKGMGYNKISEIEPKDFVKVMQALRAIR